MKVLLSPRRLTPVILVCFISIVGLEVLTHQIEITIQKNNENFAHIINVAGKQRMLSQRAALFAVKYALQPNKRRQGILRATKKELTSGQEFIDSTINASTFTNKLKNPNELVSARNHARSVTDELNHKIINLLKSSNAQEHAKIVDQIIVDNDQTLKVIDAQVKALENLSNASHAYYFHLEDYLFYGRTFVIILIFLAILLPLSNRLKTHSKELFVLNKKLVEEKKRSEEYTKIKTDFFARMSHELRTPINAIIGYSEIIEEDAECEDQKRDINRVLTSARHLLNMINEILDISKIESYEVSVLIREFDFQALCNEVIDIIEPLARKNGNTTRYVYAVDRRVITSDHEKLKQSLLNLLSNACKFTHQGSILLEVIDCAHSAEHIQIQISDTGIGMNEEQLKRVFEPFVQATDAISHTYGGTGLGLAITKSFLDALDATIEIESTIGVGTSIRIHIPKHLSCSGQCVVKLDRPSQEVLAS